MLLSAALVGIIRNESDSMLEVGIGVVSVIGNEYGLTETRTCRLGTESGLSPKAAIERVADI
jgi:hypothetical protein